MARKSIILGVLLFSFSVVYAETPAPKPSAATPSSSLASSPATPSAITQEELLAGCEIPLRREFPIDAAVSPCKDLYEYACHDVIAGFKLRPDRSAHTFSFNDSYERIFFAKKKYLKMLAAMPATEHFTPHQEALRNTYNACMNESASAAEEQQTVGQIIAAVDGIKDRDQFMKTVAHRIDEPMGEAPLKAFIDLDSDPNQDDPFRRDAIFDSDLMALPERSYYENPEVTKDFEQIVTEFFKTNHLDNAAARAKAVVAFEKDFAEHYPLPVEFRDREAERNPITRDEMLKKYPNLEFTDIFKKIPKKTKFRNLEPETFTFLNEKLATADLSTLKDFLLFHSASEFMDDAYQDYYKANFEFHRKHLGGPDKRPDRDERCTRAAMSNFGRELDEQLLPILFPGFPKKKVVHLAETVRSSILDGLKHNTWLSPEGKAAAIHKISKAQLLLVKPRTEGQWDFTPKAEYSPEHRYANALLLSHNLVLKKLREYGERRDRKRWLMGPLTVNAYYMPMDNSFVLPQGILQYPFYDPSIPEKVNLAAAGSVIGHELGHGIDDKGALYDAEGKLHQWMSDADLKEFKRRGGQFVADSTSSASTVASRWVRTLRITWD